MSINFSGQRILVTGATGGIGAAVVKRLATEGATLILLDRSMELLIGLGSELQTRSNSEPQLIEVDFADEGDLTRALRELSHKGLPLTGLVNVAGIALDAPFALTSLESLSESFQVNYTAAIRISQKVSRIMARHGKGSIVNISSITGIDGNVGQLAYGASKAALINSTIIMAQELGQSGVRVNSIAPGIIATQMTLGLSATALNDLASRPHMGRLGEPSEIASVVSWLLSDFSSYVTGQTIRVDGCI